MPDPEAQQPEPSQLGSEGQDGAQGNQPGQDGEPDYKSLYEASTQEKTALEERATAAEREAQRVRSIEIGLMRQQDRDQLQKAQAEQMQVIAEYLGEEAASKMTAVRSRHQAEATEAGFMEDAREKESELRRLVGEAGMDIDTSPELEVMRLYWNQGLRGNDQLAIEKAVMEFYKANSKVLKTKSDRIASDARRQGREEALRERNREEADVDMGPGAGVGGAAGEQEWQDRYADEVNGGIPGTPDNAKRSRQLTAKGIFPRPR